ncbi:MAG: hypothetical protein ACREXW_15210 [Gammaproteobacteria bacterium]
MRQGQAWVFAVLLGLGQVAQAVGGDPDLTFGGDGLVITDLSNAQRRDQANDLAIQFDDKIVVVGVATRDGDENVAVLRYKPDGTPDDAFGQQGVAIVDVLADEDDSAEGVVLQRDGKIVVVGRAGDFVGPGGDPGSFLVARFNLDGTLDPAFGGGQGFVTTRFGPGSNDFATAVVLQPDGRIVAAGRSNAGGSADFALARYNTDGGLDDGGPQDITPGDRFGANGLVVTDFAAQDRVLALALDASGRLVAAGCRSCDSDASDFALARYLADGQLDPSFDGDGKVSTDFPFRGRDIARGVAIQASDGKIVAGGGADDPAGADVFAVARYLPDGSLDASFGFNGDGRVTTDFEFRNDLASALIVQPDGKIVAAGNSNTDAVLEPAALALAQYRADGSLDIDFGNGGQVLTCLSPAGVAAPCDAALGTLTRARAVVLQRDGKLVVAGIFAPVSDDPDAFDFLVARYNPAIVVSEVLCQGKTPTLFGSPEQATLRGTTGDDVIVGSVAGDFIIGGGGNDTICGGPGDDRIFGEDGDDAIEGGDGDDTLIGGPGADMVRGGPGGDTIFGEDDGDTVEGEDGDDRLFGGAGADVMSGGPGVDTVFGEGDVDTVQGDDGDDKLFGGADADVLRGGPGGDTIFGEDDGDTVEGEDGDDKLFGGTGVDRLAGGLGRDTVFGEEDGDTIEGGDDDDTLVGGPGADVMRGGFGRDMVLGGDDRDAIEGGDGPDELVGGEGNDQLDGGNDDDMLFGAGGNDVLLGGPGGDTLVGGGGSDTLDGGRGRDMAFGGSGDDVLRGGDQKDTFLGEAGNDRIFGGPGNDVLFGGGGRDNMRGNAGPDTMVGEGGRDRANGGQGADTCFSVERRGSCDPSGGKPPRKPTAPDQPPPPQPPPRPPTSTPPPVCNFPGCGG